MRLPLSILLVALAACGEGPAAVDGGADGGSALAGERTDAAPDSAPDGGSDGSEQSGGEAEPDDYETPTGHQVDGVRPPASEWSFPELPAPELPPPEAGEMVSIPGGTLARGSHPRDPLRDQYAENDQVATPVTPFEMDVLPYPNDPDLPFLTGVTRAEAAALCAEQGKRLCTEVEWEWACKGEDGRRYPSGNRYEDDRYPPTDPLPPASPFGVFALGRVREWTASQWGLEPDQVERAALRGYSPGALTIGEPTPPEQGRRCAKRWPQQPDLAAEDLGLRCCRGQPNEEICFIERTRPAHSLYSNMKPDKFARVIRQVPELEMIHDNPHMFSEGDIRAVLARRRSDREKLADQGIHFRWKPMRWIPRQGTELWVAVGRSDLHSFVVALHEVVDNEVYVHASSLILYKQPIPLALAYREGHRDEMYWAPCWGCRDGGSVAWDEESNQVIITHKW